MRKIYKILIVVFMLSVLYWGQEAFATNSRESCSFNGGTVCTNVSDDLADGATGINPAQTVNRGFSVDKKDTFDPPDCNGSRQLFYAVRHYIAGSATDYEYLSAGSGQNIQYTFNSGVDQQNNRYVGVFYCWTSSQGTDKGSLDLLLGTLGTQGQTWSSPEFNIQTRATTINPDCSKITSCSNYPVQNDCTGNRCNLSPACRWTGSVCVATTPTPTPSTPSSGTNVFNLPNPIGVTNFQDLINIIGVWIFNLAIPIAVIIIIYAGVLMLTAGGVPAKFQKGAKALWYAVIGLAIVLIGKGFVTLIQSILSLRNK